MVFGEHLSKVSRVLDGACPVACARFLGTVSEQEPRVSMAKHGCSIAVCVEAFAQRILVGDCTGVYAV